MRVREATVLVWLVSLATGVCGCADSDVERYEAFERELYAAWCARGAACGARTEAACIADAERGDLPITPLPHRAAAFAFGLGGIRYDPAAAAACIQWAKQLNCNPYVYDEPNQFACGQVVTGMVADSESCSFHRQCASGYCSESPDTRDGRFGCRAGTCRVATSSDIPCERSDGGFTGMCRDEGMECTYLGCIPTAGVDESCSDTPCSSGLACLRFGGTTAGVCHIPPGEGGICRGLLCDSVGLTCYRNVCRPRLLMGDPCDPNGQPCSEGTCDATSGRCGDLPQIRLSGEPCGSAAACVPDLACRDFLDGPACAQRAPNGEPCRYSDDCIDGFCGDGYCVEQYGCH